MVALLDGMGLAGNPMVRIPEQQVLVQMKQFFDVKPVSGDVEKLPDDTRVLMVVHPQDLIRLTKAVTADIRHAVDKVLARE